jgi:septin family protein
MNTLFNTDLNEIHAKKLTGKTTGVNSNTYELEEDGVVLHLTVVDTPGFGDQLNREDSYAPITNYIETQYNHYLAHERSSSMRRNIPDTRIHALLYFISPGGLKDLDIAFLQKLCTLVNIVPVVGKADSLGESEKRELKRNILRDFEKFDIRVYPTSHAEDRDEISELEKHMPFAVVGSDEFVESCDGSGKLVRGRKYRWGNVEVENPLHSDFPHLSKLLLSTNLSDLIDQTHTIHYANYRSTQIRGLKTRPDSFLACDEQYVEKIENAKKSVVDDMQKKEDEMRGVFVAKVREKEANLREREEKLNQKRLVMMEELEKLKRGVENEEVVVLELTANRKGRK